MSKRGIFYCDNCDTQIGEEKPITLVIPDIINRVIPQIFLGRERHLCNRCAEKCFEFLLSNKKTTTWVITKHHPYEEEGYNKIEFIQTDKPIKSSEEADAVKLIRKFFGE